MSMPRHPATASVLRHFEFAHLPPHLAAVSVECHELAHRMVEALPDSPELTVGLRKLLEAKDCFVRAAVDANPPVAPSLPRRPIADNPQA